ncbi:phage integrase N-terminal domain-containing protein [Photorhabdus tasmaniensis]|uniref:phage integrase N-terminal domain-containing protein n=1 Tax=Photorhabdus tasmaniensis TaxID=1004159 RepID=UPI0040426932
MKTKQVEQYVDARLSQGIAKRTVQNEEGGRVIVIINRGINSVCKNKSNIFNKLYFITSPALTPNENLL